MFSATWTSIFFSICLPYQSPDLLYFMPHCLLPTAAYILDTTTNVTPNWGLNSEPTFLTSLGISVLPAASINCIIPLASAKWQTWVKKAIIQPQLFNTKFHEWKERDLVHLKAILVLWEISWISQRYERKGI